MSSIMQETQRVERALKAMKTIGRDCAFFNVRQLSRSLETIYDEAFSPFGIGASQVALLWTIFANEPVALKTIARIARMDQTTVSRIVARAEGQGLVEMQRAEPDRRQKLARLSALGRTYLASVFPAWKSTQGRVAAVIGAHALKKMAATVNGIRRSRSKRAAGHRAVQQR